MRKLKQSPRSRPYHYRFNKKIKISRLNYTQKSLQKNGIFIVKFTETCQLRYTQLTKLHLVLLPFLKAGQIKL